MSKKETKLESYFSPTTSKIVKRRRSKSSPEEINTEKVRKKENMALSLESLSDLLDKKFATFSATVRDDFKMLENKIDALVKENQSLKNDILEMKIRENKMEDAIEQLVNRNKMRNLVFRGLGKDKNLNTVNSVKEICQTVLGLENIQVNKARDINKNHPKNIIIAEFKTEEMTFDILTETKKLKGSGIIIHRDISGRTRRRKRCLLQARKILLELDNQARIRMRDSFFLFNEHRFTWDFEEGLKCDGKNGLAVLKNLYGTGVTEEVERSFQTIVETDRKFGTTRDVRDVSKSS